MAGLAVPVLILHLGSGFLSAAYLMGRAVGGEGKKNSGGEKQVRNNDLETSVFIMLIPKSPRVLPACWRDRHKLFPHPGVWGGGLFIVRRTLSTSGPQPTTWQRCPSFFQLLGQPVQPPVATRVPALLKRAVLALWKSVEAYSWGLRHPFHMKGYSHPFHFPVAQKYPLRVTALAILFLTFWFVFISYFLQTPFFGGDSSP